MAGQIIILNGTSGAGKSTTCLTFARRAETPYLMFGVDTLFGAMYPGKFSMFGERTREGFFNYHEDARDLESVFRCGFGAAGWTWMQAFNAMTAAASRAGANVVLDHLLFVDPPILQDCIWRTEGLPVLLVDIRPPYDVLMERIGTRNVHLPPPMVEAVGEEGARTIVDTMQKLTPWFYRASYANDIVDLVVDSTRLSPEEICDAIEARLAAGPGTAFDRLRARYPRPAA